MSTVPCTSPTVSVVIGVFNAADALPDTLDSVLAQTAADWECIVVDDGSSDSTARVIEGYAAREPRVRGITLPVNGGLTRALIHGVESAQGQWLARIDAGDRWLPEKLARQLAFSAAHPEIGLIGCWSEDRNHVSGEVVVKQKPVAHEAIVAALWRICPFVHSTILARLDLVRTCGGYNPEFRYAQDLELYFRLLQRTRGHNLPEALCKRVTHQVSAISFARWKPQLRCSLAIRWKYHRLYRRPLSELWYFAPDLLRLLLPASCKGLIQRFRSHRHAHPV